MTTNLLSLAQSMMGSAFKGAGVPEASIEMRAPMFVEAGGGSSDAEARRVEISKL